MRLIPVLLAATFLMTAPMTAMTFSLDGDTVRAAGPIGQGDAERLRSFLGRLQHDEMNYLSVTVALDSPGGNLMEGMRLGMAIREAGVPTLVRQGETRPAPAPSPSWVEKRTESPPTRCPATSSPAPCSDITASSRAATKCAWSMKR